MNNQENVSNEGCNLRKCSFDAKKYVREIINANDGTKTMYLMVPDRVLWFNIYCEENNLKGVIDESNIQYIPELKMFQAVCVVTIDGDVVGKGVGSRVYEEGEQYKAIESAATSAKGRALANAGFGTAMCYQDDPDVGEGNMCDSGVPSSKGFDDISAFEGMDNPLVPKQEKAPKAVETVVSAMPSTLEEAQKIVLMINNSKYNGKTLGEINALDPQYIEWLAEKYNPRKHPEYKEGAKIIVANAA